MGDLLIMRKKPENPCFFKKAHKIKVYNSYLLYYFYSMTFATRLLKVLSIVAIIIGFMIKMEHWPGGDYLFDAGLIGLALAYIIDLIIGETNRTK